jgi:hypothetical protein
MAINRDVEELEWELLPPEEKQKRAELEPLFRWLAFFMDNLLQLPGTKLRFGLDPLLGLLPAVGDTGSAIISALALIAAARRGLPKILLARMGLNILINEAVGIIPVLGDAFSFWFKSNQRNYELLKRYDVAPRATTRSNWIFVGVILLALGMILVVSLAFSFWLLYHLGKLLGRSAP